MSWWISQPGAPAWKRRQPTDLHVDGRRRAFSLVELVVSIAVMSVLAVGISSAVLVSSRAVEQTTSTSACIRNASSVSHDLAAELGLAVGVSERSTNAITLSVPDRDADGVSEDIRYSWSGTAGASIYRQYNAQTALPVLDNVHVFQLGYDLVNVVFENPPGGETLFAQHDATTDVSTMSPSSSVRVSQCFAPAVPSGGTGWRVKGVALVCRQKGDPGGDVIIDFALPLSDGRPGTVVCQATVKESAMGTMLAWQSFPVTACGSYLSPSQSLCIVVRGSATDSCELKKHDKNAAAAGRYFYTSTNSGSTWTLQTGKALLFQVFGNVQGVGDADLIASRLGQVRWQLQVGGESSAMIHAGTQTANLPE